MAGSGVLRLKLAKIDQPTRRRENPQTNVTGSPGDPKTHRAGNVGLDNGQMEPRAPQKRRAFDSTAEKYPLTSKQKAAEDSADHGTAGGSRTGHQVHKGRGSK